MNPSTAAAIERWQSAHGRFHDLARKKSVRHTQDHSPQRVITNQIGPIDDGASDWFSTKYVARGIACAKCEVMTTGFNYVLELIS